MYTGMAAFLKWRGLQQFSGQQRGFVRTGYDFNTIIKPMEGLLLWPFVSLTLKFACMIMCMKLYLCNKSHYKLNKGSLRQTTSCKFVYLQQTSGT